MKLTHQQEQVYDFVKTMHGEQKRKYTGQPYHEHCLAVAKIVAPFDETPGVIEAALCHDLLEDTSCDDKLLFGFLTKTGYSIGDAQLILHLVVDLTDVYTHEAFPDKNRLSRKRLEAKRLESIHSSAQNIKAADIIDNSLSIVAHDRNFARVFIDEAMRGMDRMRAGNYQLYTAAHTILLGCGFMLNAGKNED